MKCNTLNRQVAHIYMLFVLTRASTVLLVHAIIMLSMTRKVLCHEQ